MATCTKLLTQISGSSCPVSGIWESIGHFKTTCLIAKGYQMPDYCGKKIKWKLIQIC
ncbi:hypothetical protein [Chryseobacterium pennae]|uniref:hypothetical protein n=1 Tax=Chryseobacterium pennae TaxID=2258962 RepID=UPI001401DC3E|nr:hypothetical protein [Chryseobacterium pennae]